MRVQFSSGEPYDRVAHSGGLAVICGPKEATWDWSQDPAILGGLAAASGSSCLWSRPDCTTGREGRGDDGRGREARKPGRPRRPDGAEREALWLALQPPADAPSSREEERQKCHPGWAPPSVSSPPVRSLPKAPREVAGAGGLSPDVSLESEGRDSSGSFLIRYYSKTILHRNVEVAWAFGGTHRLKRHIAPWEER